VLPVAGRVAASIAAPRPSSFLAFVETKAGPIRRRLERDGWYLARRGSAHDVYRHPDIAGIVTLPRHPKLSPAVARSIARKAGWGKQRPGL
jgi:predicted RNA binding protein YcfA (HicA-like mRNA interferase family)